MAKKFTVYLFRAWSSNDEATRKLIYTLRDGSDGSEASISEIVKGMKTSHPDVGAVEVYQLVDYRVL